MNDGRGPYDKRGALWLIGCALLGAVGGALIFGVYVVWERWL